MTDLLVHNILDKIIENIYEMVAPKRQQEQQELDVAHALADGVGIPLYHWFS